MSNIENEIKILLNLFNSAKFDILISKAKKLIKKYPEYLILYNIKYSGAFLMSFFALLIKISNLALLNKFSKILISFSILPIDIVIYYFVS